MRAANVNRNNLVGAIDYGIAECVTRMKAAEDSGSSFLIRDLHAGLMALRNIKSEIESGIMRPRGRRSCGFFRHVIDEEATMEIDSALRDLIIAIERAYESW